MSLTIGAVNVAPAPVPVKPGIRTTEFWATSVAPFVLAGLTFAFHRDFSGYVQAAAVGAAGVSSAVYAIGRAHLKRPVDLASVLYDLRAMLPVVEAAGQVAVEVAHDVPKTAPKKATK